MTQRLGATVDGIDLFCGFGGSSHGIATAGATLRVAANHNPHAVQVHAANFPDVDHHVADLQDPDAAAYIDPATLPPARFLWASPSCRFHSPANARKVYANGPTLFDDEFDHDLYARSERSRVTMLCPLRYAAHRHPEIVVIENVVEAAKWGPDRDGSTFQWWLREWEKIGYRWRALFLNSMFFPPTPQSRDRMYVVFWRQGNPTPDLDYRPAAYCISDRCGGRHVQAVQTWKRRTKAWPLLEWGKYGRQYTYRCPHCASDVDPLTWPAYSAIDWTNLGQRIGDRDRPLAPKTIQRIRRGVAKFANTAPVIVPVAGDNPTPRHVTQPYPTVTTKVRRGVAIVPNRLGGRGHHPTEPTPTQVAGANSIYLTALGHTYERPGYTRARHTTDTAYAVHSSEAFGLATLIPLRGTSPAALNAGHSITNPAGTVSAGGGHHGLALFMKQNAGADGTNPHPVTDPFLTITSRDTTALIVAPWIDQYRTDPAAITEVLATVTTHNRHALATITTGDPDTVDIDQVHFRMLDPDREIRHVMAFPDTYRIFGSKAQQIAGLGNAVTPPVATWITHQALATLKGEPGR